MRTRKRTFIFILLVLLAIASVGLVAAAAIPSADELLTNSLEALESATKGHAIVEVSAELPDNDLNATFELWGQRDAGPNGEPAIRMEVLSASKEELVGVIAVSDGTQSWLYDPTRNTVIVGNAEEMAPLLAERLAEHEGQWEHEGSYDPDGTAVPQTPEEVVANLLNYFSAERNGSQIVAGTEAYQLRLVPIPEQMPDEIRAAGGFVNLWLRNSDQLPLGAEYAESAAGYVKVEATQVEVNEDLPVNVFTFAIPAGVEVKEATQLLEEMEARQQALEEIDFVALVPSYLPDGSTSNGQQQIGAVIVDRYNLPDDKSFVIAQGYSMPLDVPAEATSTESIEVRNLEGVLHTNDTATRSLLTWIEGEISFAIGGDVSPDQALAIAESLQ
jgi:outer membrane lipoprotein-sorting protein